MGVVPSNSPLKPTSKKITPLQGRGLGFLLPPAPSFEAEEHAPQDAKGELCVFRGKKRFLLAKRGGALTCLTRRCQGRRSTRSKKGKRDDEHPQLPIKEATTEGGGGDPRKKKESNSHACP